MLILEHGYIMKLEDLEEYWSKDAKINDFDLDKESLKTPVLHGKYYGFYNAEKMRLSKLNIEVSHLKRIKWEYYTGKLCDEELDVYGWEPFQIKLLKSDIDMYLEGDADLNDLKVKISLQKQKCTFLEDIIKFLNVRGFAIKNAIDWRKFTQGAP